MHTKVLHRSSKKPPQKGTLHSPPPHSSHNSFFVEHTHTKNKPKQAMCRITSPRLAMPKQSNSKRCVRWGEDSRIEYNEEETISNNGNAPSLSHQKWYGASDIQSFKDDRKVAAKLANEFGQDAVEKSGQTTCRGVEHLQSKKSLNEKYQRHQLAVQVVLDASINYQSLTAEKREQMIAMQYQSLSLQCKKVAHERARAYWEETQQSLDSDESCVPPPPPSSSSSSTPKSRKSAGRSPSRRRGIRALLKALPVM